jgi:hypothetical protein
MVICPAVTPLLLAAPMAIAARDQHWRPDGATRAFVTTPDGTTTELLPGGSCLWEGSRPGQVIALEP